MNMTTVKATKGLKVSAGKLDWSLLPIETMEEQIKGMMDGNIKYEYENWKLQDGDVKREYYAAAMRHIAASIKGETFITDPKGDIQVRHLASAMNCLMIMMWHEMQGGGADKCGPTC